MAAEPEQDLLASIEGGQAPRRILEFAARGFLPLPPGDLVRAIASIVVLHDAELSPLAEETYRSFDLPALLSAVGSDGVRPEQIDAIARRSEDPRLLEPIIRHRSVPDATLAWLAERIPPNLQDVLVTNQARLLAAPVIVERLFENPQLSTDIRRRADEFVEEFFLKKEREEEEAARAHAAAGELSSQPTLPLEDEAVEVGEDTATRMALEAGDDESRSLFARLSTMTVAAKVKLAYKGNKEERMFLVRDNNRLVAAAVLKSPKTREADVEAITKMKNVSEDVLRIIAFRKDWMRKYSILHSIVKNPRSPIEVTLPLISRLTALDQKTLAGDRNVPEAVRMSARREVARRNG